MITKQDIAEKIAASGDVVSKAAAKRVTDSVFDCIVEGLKNGEQVRIAGFGTIEVRERKARKGINPQTKKIEEYPAYKTVCMKAGKTLKGVVNE